MLGTLWNLVLIVGFSSIAHLKNKDDGQRLGGISV